MGYKPFPGNSNPTLAGLVEGDRIGVLSAGGASDTGVFIRVDEDFLIWVRDDGPNALLTITSLTGISINKL